MYVFHGQFLPTSRTFLLRLDRPLDAALAEEMTTYGGRLLLHGVHTYCALQSIIGLFLMDWRGWGQLLHYRGFHGNTLPLPTLRSVSQKDAILIRWSLSGWSGEVYCRPDRPPSAN